MSDRETKTVKPPDATPAFDDSDSDVYSDASPGPNPDQDLDPEPSPGEKPIPADYYKVQNPDAPPDHGDHSAGEEGPDPDLDPPLPPPVAWSRSFDDVFSFVGGLGRYQLRVLFLLWPAGLLIVLSLDNIVFLELTPKHRCRLPGLPNDTYAIQGPWHEALVKKTIPVTSSGEYDSCNMNLEGDGVVACNNWVYDEAFFTQTYTTRFNLVCAQDYIVSLTTMTFFLGAFCGSILSGYLADRFGRKPVLMANILIFGIVGFTSVFIPSWEWYIGIRFILGAVTMGTVPETLALELVSPAKRMLVGSLMHVFFIFGGPLLAGLAAITRNWQYLEIVCAAPAFLILWLFCYIPESPRWLLTAGRRQEADRILRHMARVNSRAVSEKILEEVEASAETKGGGAFPWKEMRQSPKLLQYLAVIGVIWLLLNLVHYGLIFNLVNIPGNIFLNFFLYTLLDIPGFAMAFTVNLYGRETPFVGLTLVGGMVLLTCVFVDLFVPSNISMYLIIGLSSGARLSVSAAYTIIALWSEEIFPTVIRNFCMGLVSFAASIGAMAAPFISRGVFSKALANGSMVLGLYGTGMVVAGILATLFLPETAYRKLPDTIKEAENFGLYSSPAENDEKMLDAEDEDEKQPVVPRRKRSFIEMKESNTKNYNTIASYPQPSAKNLDG
ncbi:organic cation transporter protein [Lingula anatina]|uniref:Organic cation transporter protein n=1 Tax=Lingula anatina TaxID=7574 RepID=A0A1S3HBT0_LINAN|nr:organic cation transporter protein [Lingula anatina]|eukprot:XP_013382971.1 organic cation transporter protein [Lingula anatina]